MRKSKKETRFNVFEGYKFDKYLFRYCFLFVALIVLGLLIYMKGHYNNDNFYYVCKDMPCSNPFYCRNGDFICENSLKDATIPEGFPLDREVFPVGFEWGNKPPLIYEYFQLIFIGVLLFGFLINHFLHNKGFDFKAFYKRINEEK